MREVHYHPDGRLYVRTDDVTYGDTLANAAKDFGMAIEPLPAGINERLYQPGRRHPLIKEDVGVIDGGPDPWSHGEQLLSAVSGAVAAQKVRVDAEYEAAQPELAAQQRALLQKPAPGGQTKA